MNLRRSLLVGLLCLLGSDAAAERQRPPRDVPHWRWAPSVPQKDAQRQMMRAILRQVRPRVVQVRKRHPNWKARTIVARMASALLHRASRPSERLLPERMPKLPLTRPGEREVQQIINGALRAGRPPKDLFLYLERQAALLRGSSDDAGKATVEQLTSYLGRYKRGAWVDAWLDARLSAFADSKENQRLRETHRPRLHVDRAATNWRATPVIPSPADRRLEPIFKRCDRQWSWQTLAALERELFDVERRVAGGPKKQPLRDALADYLVYVRNQLPHTNVPEKIGPLPRTVRGEGRVQALIDRRRYQTHDSRELFLMLESTALMLRQPGKGHDAQLARQLDRYLARARRDFHAPEQVALVRQQLDQAWTIVTRAVHPQLLARVRPLKFVYGVRYPVPANLAGQGAIYLTPKSTAAEIRKDILHEIGHQLENNGGLHVLARSYNIRTRRANGAAPVGLAELIPRTNYAPDQRAYPGGAFAPYLLRYYADGATETISMAFERFASRDSMRELFTQDGAHLLMALDALQRPPRF